jgi:hypothetical protein
MGNIVMIKKKGVPISNFNSNRSKVILQPSITHVNAKLLYTHPQYIYIYYIVGFRTIYILCRIARCNEVVPFIYVESMPRI